MSYVLMVTGARNTSATLLFWFWEIILISFEEIYSCRGNKFFQMLFNFNLLLQPNKSPLCSYKEGQKKLPVCYGNSHLSFLMNWRAMGHKWKETVSIFASYCCHLHLCVATLCYSLSLLCCCSHKTCQVGCVFIDIYHISQSDVGKHNVLLLFYCFLIPA